MFRSLGSFSQKGLNMRKFIEIDLHHQQISERQLAGRELAEAGRYLIARMLVERDIAPIDPLHRKTR